MSLYLGRYELDPVVDDRGRRVLNNRRGYLSRARRLNVLVVPQAILPLIIGLCGRWCTAMIIAAILAHCVYSMKLY